MVARMARVPDQRPGNLNHAPRAGAQAWPLIVAAMARHEMAGCVVGLVGWTDAARRVAQAALARGMEVQVFHARPLPRAQVAALGVVQVGTLAALLAGSDVVSVHAAPDPIRGTEIDYMRPHAVLVNTAYRGAVDETALSQALMFDLIGGAALAPFPGQRSIDPMLAQCETLATGPVAAPPPPHSFGWRSRFSDVAVRGPQNRFCKASRASAM